MVGHDVVAAVGIDWVDRIDGDVVYHAVNRDAAAMMNQFCRGSSWVTKVSRKSAVLASPAGLMTNLVSPAAM